MVTCGLCTHPKISAIESSLTAQVDASVIAAQLHVPKKLIALHAAHYLTGTRVNRQIPVNARDEAHRASSAHVGGLVGQGAAPTDDPMRRVRYHASGLAAAWREVDEAWRTMARLERLLKDAFEDEGLGL